MIQLVEKISVFRTDLELRLVRIPTARRILSLFNLLGKKVKEEKVTGSQVTFDVSLLPQGLYLVRTENSVVGKPTFVNTTVGKFVKE